MSTGAQSASKHSDADTNYQKHMQEMDKTRGDLGFFMLLLAVHGIPKSQTQLSDLAHHSTSWFVAKQKHVFRKTCKINYVRQREELIK